MGCLAGTKYIGNNRSGIEGSCCSNKVREAKSASAGSERLMVFGIFNFVLNATFAVILFYTNLVANLSIFFQYS